MNNLCGGGFEFVQLLRCLATAAVCELSVKCIEEGGGEGSDQGVGEATAIAGDCRLICGIVLHHLRLRVQVVQHSQYSTGSQCRSCVRGAASPCADPCATVLCFEVECMEWRCFSDCVMVVKTVE